MSKALVNLKAIREQRLLTMQQLSDLTAEKGHRVCMGVIWKAEKGKNVSLASIKRLAEALGVEAAKLLK